MDETLQGEAPSPRCRWLGRLCRRKGKLSGSEDRLSDSDGKLSPHEGNGSHRERMAPTVVYFPSRRSVSAGLRNSIICTSAKGPRAGRSRSRAGRRPGTPASRRSGRRSCRRSLPHHWPGRVHPSHRNTGGTNDRTNHGGRACRVNNGGGGPQAPKTRPSGVESADVGAIQECLLMRHGQCIMW